MRICVKHIGANPVCAINQGFDTDAETDLLTALSRAGICARFSCRNGNCGLCEAELNSGSVWMDDHRLQVDAPARILLCRAHACSDLVLTVAQQQPVLSRFCRVLSVQGEQGWQRVVLQLPAGRLPKLEYGHALRLEANVSARDVSIVRLPSSSAPREVEIWLSDDDPAWLAAMSAGSVRVLLPLGAPFANPEQSATVLVDKNSWDRGEVYRHYLQQRDRQQQDRQSQNQPAITFLCVDASAAPVWFAAHDATAGSISTASSTSHASTAVFVSMLSPDVLQTWLAQHGDDVVVVSEWVGAWPLDASSTR